MRTEPPDYPWILDQFATRQHLITMLDQSMWLLQWAANTPALTAEERQNVEQRLALLDQALRAVLAPQQPPGVSGILTSET